MRRPGRAFWIKGYSLRTWSKADEPASLRIIHDSGIVLCVTTDRPVESNMNSQAGRARRLAPCPERISFDPKSPAGRLIQTASPDL